MRNAALILAGAFMASRVLGVVKNTVLYSTTPSTQLNAFITAFRIPDLLFLMLSGGALTSALIPALSQSFASGDDAGAWRTATAVFNSLLVLLLGAGLLAFALAPLYSPWLLSRGQADVDLTVRLTRIMLLQPLSLALASVLMGVYNATHRFAVPAVAPLLYNLAFIGGALLVPRYGVEAVAWGVSLGGMAQLLAQGVGLRRDLRRYYRPALDLADAGAREVMRLMGPRLFGQVGLQLTLIVTTYLANSLHDDRVNPALNAAFALITLPVGIFGASIAVAAFPTFAEQAARGDVGALRAATALALRRVLFLTVPAAVGVALLAPHLVGLLFGYGQASAGQQAMTAWAVLFYAVGLPAHAAVEVLPRVFFALRDTRTPVAVNLCTLALVVVLSLFFLFLFPRGTAYQGLALALSLGVSIEAVWLAVLLRRRLRGLDGTNLRLALGRIFLACAGMEVVILAALAALEPLIPAGRITGDLPLSLLSIALGGATYVGVARLLGSEEVSVVERLLHRGRPPVPTPQA
ncbi:MAG: murein biosynthesis integral membrane protein MurJ [Chloroflexota bacterium]